MNNVIFRLYIAVVPLHYEMSIIVLSRVDMVTLSKYYITILLINYYKVVYTISMGTITLNLVFAIFVFIFASIGFLLFIIIGFALLLLLIYKEKPLKYDENASNCPYKIEKD